MNAHRSFSARADIETILAHLGAERLDVPVLQPADPFLDTAGEELRRRIFLSESETGETLCLRPEFTIPVCLQHIGEGKTVPRRYGYVGTVFRQRRAGGNEFLQAGIEDIGDADSARADARSLADALAFLTGARRDRQDRNRARRPGGLRRCRRPGSACRRAGRCGSPRLRRPRDARRRARHAGHARIRRRTCRPISANRPTRATGRRWSTRCPCGYASRGWKTAGGRDASEIAERLLARFDAAEIAPDETALATLRAFLAIRAPLAAAADALKISPPATASTWRRDREFRRARGRDWTRRASTRRRSPMTRLSAARSITTPRWSTRSTTPDGLVLAGGGRYDRLLTMLGAEKRRARRRLFRLARPRGRTYGRRGMSAPSRSRSPPRAA